MQATGKATEIRDFLSRLELPPMDTVHVGRRFDFSAVPRRAIFGVDDLQEVDGVTTSTSEKQSAAVNAGSLTSFVAGVSRQNQADALNSTLLAQLAANKKYNREKDTENWYSVYKDVLEKVGWVVQGFHFEKYDAVGSTFALERVVVDVLTAVASGPLGRTVTVVRAAMDALKKLPDDDQRRIIFDQSSHSTSNGNFQISPCAEADGQLVMATGAFYFTTTQQFTNFLWFNFSSASTSVYKGAQAITLNKDTYSSVRSEITKKLGKSAQTFVKTIEL